MIGRVLAAACLLALATAQTMPAPTNSAKADSTLKVKAAAGKPTTLEFATGMDSADAEKKGSYSFTNNAKGSLAFTAKLGDSASVPVFTITGQASTASFLEEDASTMFLEAANMTELPGNGSSSTLSAAAAAKEEAAASSKLPAVVGGTAFTVVGATKVSNPAAAGSASVKARGVYTVAGRKQWRMVASDDMAEITGWTKKGGQKILEPVTCSSGSAEDAGADAFLGPRFGTGSDCNAAFFSAQKTYELPTHTQVRVTGRYHFIDSWSNDTYVAYAKVGERTAWSYQYNYCHKLFTAFCREYSISVCGDDRYPEKLSHRFDFTLSHSAPSLQLEMGMDSLTGGALSCTQIRSWGIDDVEVFVR